MDIRKYNVHTMRASQFTYLTVVVIAVTFYAEVQDKAFTC